MLNMNLQFFAHKKGVGSTKNGRDSESKRLGAKRADGQSTLEEAAMTHCSPKKTASCVSSARAGTANRLPYIRLQATNNTTNRPDCIAGSIFHLG